MSGPWRLAAEGIGKSFAGRRVLVGASLWAEPGTVTCLVGRNGCGKTTLLKIAAGLLRPDYGVVIYDGERWVRPRLHVLARRGLFYLPERGLLLSALTVGDHLEAGRRFGSPAPSTDRAADLLGVDQLVAGRPRTLSGGERRRCELAVGLSRRPKCLLADEPFLGLDPVDREVLSRGIRQAAQQGCAVVVTGHEVPSLFGVADRVIWMSGGSTLFLGSTDDAVRHDGFKKDYLGPGGWGGPAEDSIGIRQPPAG